MSPARVSAGSVPPETADVRPGEQLPWDRLEAWLRPRLTDLGVDPGPVMEVLQFPNGSANLTYLLSFGSTRLVLRRPPFGQIAPGAHDMRREYRVLSQLWRSYDRAPRAYLFCDDHDVVGGDFVVSEYRPGVVIWGAVDPSMTDVPDAGRLIGLATVDALADLHLVDPDKAGVGDLGKPQGYVQRQVSGWRHRWDLVATPEHEEAMGRTFEILSSRIPEAPPPAVLHNDFKPDNCQFAPGRPERVVSVFDWDMATLGDPLVDLGTLLNYWPDPSDTEDDRALAPAGLETLGLPTRAEVVDRYAARTGTAPAPATVRWYESFAAWKTSVVCQQLYIRFSRGESSDPRMRSYRDSVPALAARALRLARDLERV